MYRVLTPIYAKTGLVTVETIRERSVTLHWEAVSWKELGVAFDMADAKQRFGGYPVLGSIEVLKE